MFARHDEFLVGAGDSCLDLAMMATFTTAHDVIVAELKLETFLRADRSLPMLRWWSRNSAVTTAQMV